jgi:glucose/arabinose dehydrogenase
VNRPALLGLVALLAQPSCRACARDAPDASGCELVPKGQLGHAGTTPVRAERVASGLEVPWGLAFLPGGDVLVTERPGRVRLLRGGRLEERPVLEVPVSARSEGGLLGIALAPDFATSRAFFLYLTVERGRRQVNRVARYVLAEDARSAREERVLLDDIPAEQYHDGGRLRVGPDGQLYVGTGDAGEPTSAQRLETPAGKLLRIAPDGAIPKDNPFPGSPVFLLGIRNLEAFDWRADGALVLADHGPSGELRRTGHDRVLVVERGGANLGWPDVYGCQGREGMPAPSLSWVDAVPPGGGAIYTGSAIPDWKGSFLVGTLRSRHLHRVVFAEDGRRVARHEVYFEGDPPRGLGRLREVVMGPDGAVWVTTSNCDGRGTCPPQKDEILRILPR